MNPEKIDFFSSEYLANRFVVWSELRQKHPFFFSDTRKGYVVSRHEDIQPILESTKFDRADGDNITHFRVEPETENEQLMDMFLEIVLTTDNKKRIENRKNIASALQPASAIEIAILKNTIRQCVHEQIVQCSFEQEMDFIADFCIPLQVRLFRKIVNIPDSEQEVVFNLIRNMRNAVYSRADDSPQAVQKAIQKTYEEAFTYLKGYFDDIAVLPMALFFITQGFNIGLMTLCCHMVLAMEDFPEAVAQVRQDSTLASNFVDEVIRYYGFLHHVCRRANTDVQCRGMTFKKDDLIFLLLGSADQDEAAFANPRQFSLSRNYKKRLSLGVGLHSCLGRKICQLTGEALMRELLHADYVLRAERDGLPQKLLTTTVIFENMYVRAHRQPTLTLEQLA